jgi:radical SAM superfamily enzyme YgiQ (UPF0313 family)
MGRTTRSEPLKILLVKPKARLSTVLGLQRYQLLEPLELGYLAAMVPQQDVRIVDLRLKRSADRAFVCALKSHRPDIVGFTGYIHESAEGKRVALIARDKLRKAKIIVGGHHATVAPQDYNLDQIDAVVRGEGCNAFKAFVDAVAADEEELTGIEGVLTRGRDLEAPTEWPRFPDPADLPHPRRDLWNYLDYYSVWAAEEMPKYHTIYPPVAMVRTSWGCRMKCSFCIVPFLCGGRHLPRPLESIVDEIEDLKADHVYFSDDENFIDEEFAAGLAEAIEKRGIGKRYFAWARSTTVNRNPELFQNWRNIGLDGAFLGFEFINDEEMREFSKACTVASNEKALGKLRAMKVVVHAGFMLRPEYTRERFAELREYVRAMPPSQCSFTVITPSPGTPDYKGLEKDLWVPDSHDIHDCMHPITRTALPLREFAELYAQQASEGVSKTPLRVNRHIAPPSDMFRIWRSDVRYREGFRKLYRDYPREMWDWKGTDV